jgi:hypothetical protein
VGATPVHHARTGVNAAKLGRVLLGRARAVEPGQARPHEVKTPACGRPGGMWKDRSVWSAADACRSRPSSWYPRHVAY